MATGEGSLNLWIKQRRRALDLTQEDVAECVGCSRIAIQKIELGERRPSKQVAQRLAHCLQLPADEQVAFISYARSESGAGGPLFDETALSTSPQSLHEPGGRSNPSNLPSALTPLLGRGQAVATARDYLMHEDIRLLTFTGAPGIGKTRMALQVAADVLPGFSNGVFLVELAPISDPSLVVSTIATAVGLTEISSNPMRDALKEFLGVKSMLLVLDNFEQVLDAAPPVIELLSYCPHLKVLVTSREALHVPGEQQFPVTPLDLPDLGRLPALEALPDYAAIALFVERAVAVDPSFRLTLDNAQEVATICTRLDGLPLAIELAAAHIKLLSPVEMLARLDNQLRLLTSARGARYEHLRHLPARQQTMRAAIDWSYQILEKGEQQLLSRLGVFVGGWTLEAAEAVCGPGAADGIESLLEKSLLRRLNGSYEGLEHEHRFTMLASVREYALEGLEASGEGELLRRHHALYFLEFAERAEPYLRGSEQAIWFKRLERERSNMRAAMSWALAREEEDIALRFGGALRAFWYNRYSGEGRWWLEGALKGRTGDPSLTRARALDSAAMVLRKTREYPQAKALLEESLQIYRELGDGLGIATSLYKMADLIAGMAAPGDRAQIEKLYQESLERFREMGDRQGIAVVLNNMGERAREERDYPRAIDTYERSLALFGEAGDKQRIANTKTNLAYTLYHCGDYDRAKALLIESLRLFQEVASVYSAACGLVALAGIVQAGGDPRKAARLIGAANALAAPGGALFDPVDQDDREEIEEAIRAELSEDDWQSAQDEGRAMSLDEAIHYALEVPYHK